MEDDMKNCKGRPRSGEEAQKAVFLSNLLAALIMSACIFALNSPLQAAAIESVPKITILPDKIDPKCRNGRATIYDECSDQIRIFRRAVALSRKENKVLLVSFGAEWCIWCHVFESHIKGERGIFTYTYGKPDKPDRRYTHTMHEREKHDVSAEAKELRAFVARSFVIVNLDIQHAPNTLLIMQATGAYKHYGGGIPFIVTLDKRGFFAARLNSSRVEIRRDTYDWYRGYDRKRLLAELKRMYKAALAR